MKGDYTRNTYRPERRYTAVRLQQGRVQIDADWNEQVDIAVERVRAGTRDVIGAAGGPLPTPGFEIVADARTLPEKVVADLTKRRLLPLADGNLLIMPGRYYVDGAPVDNPAATTLAAQPDGGGTKLADGRHLVYLDVWEQHLTYVEDERMREVALGGPDTATRTRQVWQVRTLPVGDAFHCLADDAGWNTLVAGSTGRMAARAEPATVPVDPCVVPASAGYRGLQNRLYRVEIHAGGTLATATLKWSRDNGTVLFPIDEVNVGGAATRVRLRRLGRDDELSLRVGDWVEVLDDDNEPTDTPGLLTQVADIDADDLIVTLANPVAGVDPARHAKLRRWDSAGAIRVGPPRWIAIEDGIEVRFEAGSYRTGDYWLIPARTILGNPLLVSGNGLDWPIAGGAPIARAPEGIVHGYARLAVVRRSVDGQVREHDCRSAFPALTELRQLHYVSGDGQEAMPDLTSPATRIPLAEPLRVGVSNGRWPVAGASVRFRLAADSLRGELVAPAGATPDPGSPQSAQERTFLTAADGTAACEWRLDGHPNVPVQQVEASLLDAGGTPVHLPLVYTANLSLASRVAYDPGSCRSLESAREVQQAIDLLATLVQMHYGGGDGQEAAPGETLPRPLQVRVASACGPIVDARVFFETPDGGRLAETWKDAPSGDKQYIARTNGEGLAIAFWLPNKDGPLTQHVQARLDRGTLRVGAFTAIDFNGHIMPRSQGTEPGVRIAVIAIGVPPSELVMDDVYTPQALADGIRLTASEPVDLPTPPSDGLQQAVLTVSVGLPYPLTKVDQTFWLPRDEDMPVFGFTMLELEAKVAVNGPLITWTPSRTCEAWLTNLLFPALKRATREVDRLLVRLTLRGNFVLGADSDLHVDGELFRSRQPPGYALPSGDGRRGGMLELWFWLVDPERLPVPAVEAADPGDTVPVRTVGGAKTSRRRRKGR